MTVDKPSSEDPISDAGTALEDAAPSGECGTPSAGRTMDAVEFQTVDIELLDPDLELAVIDNFMTDANPMPLGRDVIQLPADDQPLMAAEAGLLVSSRQDEGPFQPAPSASPVSPAHETAAKNLSRSSAGHGDEPDQRGRSTAAEETDSDPRLRDRPWIPVMPCAPRYTPFVLECSEGKFELSADCARPMPPDEILPCWHTLITDFFTAPGPGTILVESASPKYAHVLAKRTLQRNGELAQHMELHPLVRRAVAPGQLMLTYQPMPSQHLNRLKDQYARSAHGFLLHDTVTLLFGLLHGQPRDTTTTLILHLPKSLVLLCGRNGGLLWARRYTLSDDHGDDFQRGVDAVMIDMRQAARDGGFELQRSVWIEGWSRRPVRPANASGNMEIMPVTALKCGDDTWYSALPGLVEGASGRTSLTPFPDRFAARLQPLEKWCWAASLALALAAVAAGWWGHGLADRMEERLQGLLAEKAGLESQQTELAVANTLSEEDRKTIELGTTMALTLKNARSAARAADVWNLVGEARPQACTIQSLEMVYEGKTATIGMEGTIGQGLNQARNSYSEFLSRLGQAGFRIAHQEFQLDMEINHFTVTLERSAEE